MIYLRPDLPAGHGRVDSLPEEVWDRLERVLDRFENAWRRGERPDPEEYLAAAAAERRVLLRELVQEDMDYRCRRGEAIRAEAYLERFPELHGDPALVAELTAVAQRFCCPPAGNGALPPRAPDMPRITPPPTPRPEASAEPAAADFPRLPGYEVTGVLGRGGMGVVYQARHLPLNRPVALKMILAGVHAGPEDRARFRHEAEAVACFQHPNIVQVYEVGDHDSRPYAALEFVAGGSLAQHLAGAPQPSREAARLVETLARAIHYAHQHGVIHRDLKPANILLQRDEGRGAWGEGPDTSSLAPRPSPLFPRSRTSA
jgi:hypothetical protein